MTRSQGFTLVELLVALVIMAILAAVSLPLYNTYTQRGYRAEAQADLLLCAQAMERWASVNFSYLGAADTDADGVGDANAGAIAAEVCTPASVGAGRYTVSVNGTAAGFTVAATPVANQVMDGDGLMNVDDAGNRGWDHNDDGDTGDADEANWNY